MRHYSRHEFRGAERDGLVKQPSSNHDVGANCSLLNQPTLILAGPYSTISMSIELCWRSLFRLLLRTLIRAQSNMHFDKCMKKIVLSILQSEFLHTAHSIVRYDIDFLQQKTANAKIISFINVKPLVTRQNSKKYFLLHWTTMDVRI